MSELLTPLEAGKLLHVDGGTIRRWIKGGTLEAEVSQHGKRTFYHIKRETVDKLLSQVERVENE